MELLLVNPSGSVVEIADQDTFDRMRKQGFTLPTEEQIDAYNRTRSIQVKKMSKKNELDLQVYFASVSPEKNGYGVASQKIADAFDELSVKYSFAQKGQKIGFLFHAPYSMLRLDNPYKIIYTMFESDKLPTDWKEHLDYADKILVPSQWCMEIFAKSGYNAEVVPLGYDDKTFTYIERTRTGNEPFTFLHYDAFNVRKGFLEVFKAFIKAFGKSTEVKMIFKTTKNQVNFPLPPAEYPNIEIITGACSDEELKALMARSDCFVFPSRGEGFGMTPLEASATGLPSIIPNAHGLSEYFHKDYFYEVKVSGKTPAVYARYKNQDVGSMIECDVDSLVERMSYVYLHQEEARDVGKKASEYVKQWTYTNTAKRLQQIFDEAVIAETKKKQPESFLPMEEV